MSSKNKRLAILSEAEQAALYELPDFDEAQRLEYLSLTPQEQELITGRKGLTSQVYCALQIGYFKAKHCFFRFSLDEVPEDVAFISEQYFSSQTVNLIPITNHEYYAQSSLITKHFGYQPWEKKHEPFVKNEVIKAIKTDNSPEFIVMELLRVFQDKKWIRPPYTTLQTLINVSSMKFKL